VVVDGQIDAAEAGQLLSETQHSTHIGQAPAVDGLVVGADKEG
jgi:hypothetical protein